MSIESEVRNHFVELGADVVGFTSPVVPESYVVSYASWIDEGMHAGMNYLAKRHVTGCDCNDLLPNTVTVIALAFNYHFEPDTETTPVPMGRISRYGTIRDYHKTIGAILKRGGEFLATTYGAESRGFVDASPLMERAYAERAGLGFIGKSGMLITREFGSSVFLATLLTTMKLTPDTPTSKRACGNCRACMSACPTGAIGGDGRVDSRKCISYLTIENRKGIAMENRASLGDSVFGCDRCQTACPFNSKPKPSRLHEFKPRMGCLVSLEELLSITSHDKLVDAFAGLPVMRAKWEGMLRNACVVAGNSEDDTLKSALTRLVETTDNPMILEHARWALKRLRFFGKD